MILNSLLVDNSGLITSYTDGADSCCRNYTFHTRNFILKLISAVDIQTSIVADPAKTQSLLEVQSGIYVRNPNKWMGLLDTWYGNPKTTSRDQLTGVFTFNALRGYHGDKEGKKALSRLLCASLKRAMFAQNTLPSGLGATGWKLPDWLTPDLWAVALRGYGVWTFLPVAVLDIAMWVSVMAHLWGPTGISFKPFKLVTPGPSSTDDDNINNVLNAAQYTFDTPFSWLARKFYKWFRQPNVGNSNLGEKSPIIGALVAYHTAMGSTELANMARPIVDRY